MTLNESINRIETYIRGIDCDSFCCNEMTIDEGDFA